MKDQRNLNNKDEMGHEGWVSVLWAARTEAPEHDFSEQRVAIADFL